MASGGYISAIAVKPSPHLNSRAGSDFLWHLARQELAVFEVAPKRAALDHDLAAQQSCRLQA
jgi:hypothetical protein